MTHHLNGQMVDFAKNWCNVILTRPPKKSIVSFSKVIKNPTFKTWAINYNMNWPKCSKKNKIDFFC